MILEKYGKTSLECHFAPSNFNRSSYESTSRQRHRKNKFQLLERLAHLLYWLTFGCCRRSDLPRLGLLGGPKSLFFGGWRMRVSQRWAKDIIFNFDDFNLRISTIWNNILISAVFIRQIWVNLIISTWKHITHYLENVHSPSEMMVGRLLSFWNGSFFRGHVNFREVVRNEIQALVPGEVVAW